MGTGSLEQRNSPSHVCQERCAGGEDTEVTGGVEEPGPGLASPGRLVEDAEP